MKLDGLRLVQMSSIRQYKCYQYRMVLDFEISLETIYSTRKYPFDEYDFLTSINIEEILTDNLIGLS